MTHLRVIFVLGKATILLSVAFALSFCADSGFKGTTAKKGADAKPATPATNDLRDENDSEASPDTPVDENYDVNRSDELDDRDDTADRNVTDFEALGCEFPKDLRDASRDVHPGFSLGWGGTSAAAVTEVELKNLNLKDCDWFKNVTKDDFVLVFTDDTQSYAEPFSEGFGLGPGGLFGGRTQAGKCQQTALAITQKLPGLKIKGKVECSALPKNATDSD